MIISNVSLIQTSSAFKPNEIGFKWIPTFFIKYLIQLTTGAKTEHVLMWILGNVEERRWTGDKQTNFLDWLHSLHKLTQVYVYQCKRTPTTKELLDLQDFFNSRRKGRFGFAGYFFSLIPFLDRIKFNSSDCAQEYVIALQYINWLPSNINAASITPDSLVDLLTDYDLIEGRQRIK